MMIASVAGIGYGAWRDYHEYMEKPVPGLDEPARVSIEPGMDFGAISELLEEKGVVAEPGWWRIMARDAATRLQAGEYVFRPGMTPLQVLDMITRGDIVTVKLVVPEGYNIHDVAARLAKLGPWKRDEFVAAAGNRELIEAAGVSGDSLEGYLFPAAYNLTMSMSEKDVVEKMLARARREKTEERMEKARQLGLDWREALTLASLVEKETGKADEMPKVAAVFLNRLEKDMPLQSDPTAVYGEKDLREGVSAEDLERDHPYNTYKRRGLPPGPICNPGPRAIDAVLEPADVDYLYFVADGEGGHNFAGTYAEHKKNVNAYRKKAAESKDARSGEDAGD